MVHFHFLNGFFASEDWETFVRHWTIKIGLHRVHTGEVRIIHHQVAAFGHSPDPLIAIGRHHIALAHFFLQHLEIRYVRLWRIALLNEAALVRLVRQRRTAAIYVVSIDGAVPLFPLEILLVDRFAQLGDLAGPGFRG